MSHPRYRVTVKTITGLLVRYYGKRENAVAWVAGITYYKDYTILSAVIEDRHEVPPKHQGARK